MKRDAFALFASLLLGSAAALATGCGSSSSSATPDAGGDFQGIAARCNPLGGGSCALPFPSAIYEKDDTASATGVRVDIPLGALPTNQDGKTVDPAVYNARDGFSPDIPMLTSFVGGVDPSNLPPITDPGQSLAATSPTVILDLDTMQRVAHFGEVDVKADADPDHQALLLRPTARLAAKHHYAVAIRKSLKGKGGGALPIPPGFQAILDGTTTPHVRLERVRARYTALFAALATAGVPQTDLVVAWDFTTGSDEQVRADMLHARDTALTAMGDKGKNLTYQVTLDQPGDNPAVIARYLEGTYDVPLLLTANGTDPGLLARDASGAPMVVGTYHSPFYAEIPACAATAPGPIPVVIYGHGLMGQGSEIKAGNVQFLANHMCAVVISTDWRGMSSRDLGVVAESLNDGTQFPLVVEKLVQGFVNFIALEQIVRGPMATGADFTVGGHALIDPTRVFYYGNSQGGIYGGTFMSYDPFIIQGVLGVPGANYSMLLERSADWPTYYGILNGAYPSPLDDELLLSILQMEWDGVDPITTAAGLIGVNGDPVPNTPKKRILMMEARGDSQVPNIGTETYARTMGIPLLGPAVEMPYALGVKPGTLDSALTIYDMHNTPVPPLTNSALDDNGAHGELRKRLAAQDQMKTFFDTQAIVQTCVDGMAQPVACDCPTDAICGPQI